MSMNRLQRYVDATSAPKKEDIGEEVKPERQPAEKPRYFFKTKDNRHFTTMRNAKL